MRSTYARYEWKGAPLLWEWSSAGCASVGVVSLAGDSGNPSWTCPASTCLVVKFTQSLQRLLDLCLIPLLSCSCFLGRVGHVDSGVGSGCWLAGM